MVPATQDGQGWPPHQARHNRLVYRFRIILQKVGGFFSLALDGGGLGWG
jgi:hypothetical protein